MCVTEETLTFTQQIPVKVENFVFELQITVQEMIQYYVYEPVSSCFSYAYFFNDLEIPFMIVIAPTEKFIFIKYKQTVSMVAGERCRQSNLG